MNFIATHFKLVIAVGLLLALTLSAYLLSNNANSNKTAAADVQPKVVNPTNPVTPPIVITTKKTKVVTPKPEHMPPIQKVIAAIEPLEQEKESGNSLKPQQQYQQKQHFSSNIAGTIHQKLAAATEQVETQEIPEQLQQDMLDMFKTAADKDWSKFAEATEELEQFDYQTLNLALLQAITHNAPMTVIQQLLNKGAQLSPQTSQILALQNNVALAIKLLPLGLDLHAVDQFGRNAINQTLVTFTSREMFLFLLANEVSVHPSDQGLDPLDLSLEQALKSNKAFFYVERLLNNGAPIEASHRHLLQQIAQKKPRAYTILLQRVPTLSDSLS